MKKHLLILFFIFLYINLQAQVAGPISGKAFGNSALAGSNRSWINTENAAVTDEQYTTFGDLNDVSDSYTDYLTAQAFGLNIPAGVTITGIIAYVESSDMNASTADFNIRIIKGGTIGHTERSAGQLYLNSDAKGSYRTYGGNGDLWGETWTADDIKAGNFGIAISAQRATTGRETAGRIDNIRIAVYYFNPTTLPINLTGFSAIPKKDMVRLSWTTTDESGMDRFEIQRSADGTDFKSFGTLLCRNQVTANSYGFNDYAPLTGNSFYRLKILEKSGTITYSKILTVQLKTDNAASLYPSPWQKGEGLYIRNPSNEKLLIHFYSITGELVGKATTASNQVSLENLAQMKGILRYKVFDQNSEVTGTGSLVVY